MAGRISLAAFAAMAMGGTALAADYVEPTAPYNAPMFFGFVEIHGGYYVYDDADDAFDEDNGVIGGSARLAARLSPSFTVQGEVWTNRFLSSFGGSYDYPGVAAHVSWNPGDGRLFGVFGSVGNDNGWGNLANIGLEGALETDRWRIYGQAGRVFGISGEVDEENDRYWYGGAAATYYHTANLALTGSLGAASQTYEIGMTPIDIRYVNWGFRAEFKHDTFPASTYFSYRGTRTEVSSAFGDGSGVEHDFIVGLRFFFNQATLREINSAAGLVDMNPAYGDHFAY